jgi:AraC-like DNA-binding protein
MHCEAIQEARKLGGSYVYTCPIGFFFWTNPFYSGERFAGALISSGVLAINKQEMSDRIFSVCKGEISMAEIAQYVEGMPERSNEDVNALAQMALLCAENISTRESQWNNPVENRARRSSHDYQHQLDMERQLIASLRRGDSMEAQNIVRELLNDLAVTSNGNFEYFKLKAVELVVMLSRTGGNSENDERLVETSKRYLKRIIDSKNIEEVSENLCMILERMAGFFFSFQGICHASALRKAERFIWENYSRKVSLKEVADISGLSAPYFSTVFKEEMGVNLTNYLNRLRVEKASAMLRETDSSINKISEACGFEDQSWFSKIFRNYTGFSPGKYRKHGGTIQPEQGYNAGKVQ